MDVKAKREELIAELNAGQALVYKQSAALEQTRNQILRIEGAILLCDDIIASEQATASKKTKVKL